MTAQDTGTSPRIADLIATTASRRPEAQALVVTADRIPISYRDLVRLVDDLAGQLTQGGLVTGDRVALRAPATPNSSSACWRRRERAWSWSRWIRPCPSPSSAPEARPRAPGWCSSTPAAPGENGGPTLPSWPIAVTVNGDDRGAHPDATADFPGQRRTRGAADDDAMIMFTGGTTGVPKMVPWTHDNIASSVRGIIAGYGLGPQDATVAVMPLYHGHGLIAALLSTLVSGGTVLLPAARAVLGAHILGRHRRRRGHLVHRGPDDSPDPVGTRRTDRPEQNEPHCDSSAAAALR